MLSMVRCMQVSIYLDALMKVSACVCVRHNYIRVSAAERDIGAVPLVC